MLWIWTLFPCERFSSRFRALQPSFLARSPCTVPDIVRSVSGVLSSLHSLNGALTKRYCEINMVDAFKEVEPSTSRPRGLPCTTLASFRFGQHGSVPYAVVGLAPGMDLRDRLLELLLTARPNLAVLDGDLHHVSARGSRKRGFRNHMGLTVP